MNINDLKKARQFMVKKHEGQKRKWEGENIPYSIHPTRVSRLIWKLTKDKVLTTAAVLHDTLEDTDATEEEIAELFGDKVASLVKELTSSKTYTRKYGKKQYLAHKMGFGMTDDALTIKLADRFDNVAKLNLAPDKFQEKYSEETLHIFKKLNERRELTDIHKKIIRMIVDSINSL